MKPFNTIVFQEEENFRVTPIISNVLGISDKLKGDRIETIIFDPNDMSLNFATHNMYRAKVIPNVYKERSSALIEAETFILSLMHIISDLEEKGHNVNKAILKEIYIEAFLEEMGGNE